MKRCAKGNKMKNVPDDWSDFFRFCDSCGETYHLSEGECDCFEFEHEEENEREE